LRNDLHALAALFVEHPLGNNKLIAARKCHLHLMLAKRRTTPYERDRHTAVRMMWIVDRQRNMGSV
jgi:hypothetical protein